MKTQTLFISFSISLNESNTVNSGVKLIHENMGTIEIIEKLCNDAINVYHNYKDEEAIR